MKTLNFATMTIAALGFVACAKSFRALDIQAPPKIATDQKLNLDSLIYSGTNLILSGENGESRGSILIEGDDAKSIYSALNIQPIDSNPGEGFLAGKNKQGVHLSCVERALEITPDVNNYTCALELDFRTGTVKNVDKAEGTGGQISEKPAPVEIYEGTNVSLPVFISLGQIVLTGKDAEALHNNMPAGDDQFQRLGKNIKCVGEVLGDDDSKMTYTCGMYFNYFTGQVTKMEAETPMNLKVPAHSVSEPADSISEPAGSVSAPAGGVSQPAGSVSAPAGGVSQPAGSVSAPAGGVSQPAGSVSAPAGGVSMPARGISKPSKSISLPSLKPMSDMVKKSFSSKSISK
jgi:hypothetical protein